MRKFVFTDRAGVTVTGHTLAPGKFIQAKNDKNSLMRHVHECGADTPVLAALLSPIPAEQARLFSIHCWNITVDPKNGQSYTVVKEFEPVPMVTLEQRLRFAVLVAKETCRDRDFRFWAEQWLSGADTTAKSAQETLDRLLAELKAAEGLEEVGAWVESGTDTMHAQQQDDGKQRAAHALRAVELFNAPDQASAAATEIIQAVHGVERLAATLSLPLLCELATIETPLQQAAG